MVPAPVKVWPVAKVIGANPNVAGIGFFLGGGGANQANLSISLKPKERGRKVSADQIITRLRPKLANVVGVQTFLQANQDINVGGRAGRAQYQYTLSDSDLTELNSWAPRLLTALQTIPQIKDVSSDQQSQGAAVNLTIDRAQASRFGIATSDIDAAIYNLIGQREVTQYFTQLNAYHVVVEAPLQLAGAVFSSAGWPGANGSTMLTKAAEAVDAAPDFAAEVGGTAFEGSFTHVALRAANGQAFTMTLGRDGDAGALSPGAKIGLAFSSSDALVLPALASG